MLLAKLLLPHCQAWVYLRETFDKKNTYYIYKYIYGEKRNAYRLLVGKPEGRRPLGRPRCRWVENIRMDLGDVG
jgi:hypothetical protein